VIYKLRELRGVDELGGTMRLGAWAARLKPGSFAQHAYGSLDISERHRHRYEFNREYEDTLKAGGLDITGSTPDGTYVEIVEIRDHPWFLGCQFHPEFKSRPLDPHPLFKAFIDAALKYRAHRLAPLVVTEAPVPVETPSRAEAPAEALLKEPAKVMSVSR